MHPRPPALQQTWIRARFSVLTLLDLELARAPPFSASFICLLRALLVCVSACTRVCVRCNALHLFQLLLKYADCSCRQYCSFICAECVVLIPLCASPHLFVIYFTLIVAACVWTCPQPVCHCRCCSNDWRERWLCSRNRAQRHLTAL